MKINRRKPYIGLDPEILLVDEDSGKPVPASRFISASSETDADVVYDNAALEFRIKEDTCLEYVLTSVRRRMRSIRVLLDGHNVRLSMKPAANFEMDDLESHDGCMEFGCDPSILLTTTGPKRHVPDVSPDEINTRSVGFHIHLGFTKPSDLSTWDLDTPVEHLSEVMHDRGARFDMVHLMDIFLGTLGVMVERDQTDLVKKRRIDLGYGRAGEHRPKDYGMEYRVLGPWPLRNPIWTWLACSIARDCFYIRGNDIHEPFVEKFSRERVIEAINHNDFEEARDIWNEAVSMLHSIDFRDSSVPGGNLVLFDKPNIQRLEYALSMSGLEDFISLSHKHPANMFDAWNDFLDHEGQCYPATARGISNEQPSVQKFEDEWRLLTNNIVNKDDYYSDISVEV